MEIIALKEYTDKYISLYQGEIRNVNDPLAERLIEKGVVANHEDEKEQQQEREPNWVLYWDMENNFVDSEKLIPEDTLVKVIYENTQFIVPSHEVYVQYGENETVLYKGQNILGEFPESEEEDFDFSEYPIVIWVSWDAKTGCNIGIEASPEEQEKYSEENLPHIAIYYDDKTESEEENEGNLNSNIFLVTPTPHPTMLGISSLDKTFNEIKTAMLSGKNVILLNHSGGEEEEPEIISYHFLKETTQSQNSYTVDFDKHGMYIADSPEGLFYMDR